MLVCVSGQGARRLFRDMPDVSLDVPAAHTLLEELGTKLHAEGVISSRLLHEIPAKYAPVGSHPASILTQSHPAGASSLTLLVLALTQSHPASSLTQSHPTSYLAQSHPASASFPSQSRPASHLSPC